MNKYLRNVKAAIGEIKGSHKKGKPARKKLIKKIGDRNREIQDYLYGDYI
jgi:uncharacterized protein YaaN involved in tellurite resistance